MLRRADEVAVSSISFDDERFCVEIDRMLRFWCVGERLTELASCMRVASSTSATIGLRDDVVARVSIDDEC
jgi:hypothetical protein